MNRTITANPRIANHTPWSHVTFQRGDIDDRRYVVTVVQGIFGLSGRALVPVTKPSPIHLVDTFWGETTRSSVRRPGVIGFREPQSDVTVNAAARSASPRTEWPVRLKLGKLDSKLLVRGPHHWVPDGDGWRLTEPEPCTSVALVYENAFGGGEFVDDELVEEPRNPIGTGFLPDGAEDRKPRRAPQVVAANEPEHVPGERYAPRGWGAIPSYFAPRTEHVGTCDAEWERTQWPRPPKDFDDAFYQAAHPDLIYPGYLRGDESFRLEGVTVSGEPIVGQLPGLVLVMKVHLRGGMSFLYPAVLDHVHLDVLHPDPEEHRAHLTWRGILPKSQALEAIELAMVHREALEAMVA